MSSSVIIYGQVAIFRFFSWITYYSLISEVAWRLDAASLPLPLIAWNTIYMTTMLEYLKQEEYPISEEDISHLSPARFEHINPYGKYRFNLAGNQNRQGLRLLRPL